MTWHYERLEGGSVVLLIQVLAAKRLIANFPEVSSAHRCEKRTSDSASDCWCRLERSYFQTPFTTSFQHPLQNGGRKTDGWCGRVNMWDWNDAQSVQLHRCGGWCNKTSSDVKVLILPERFVENRDFHETENLLSIRLPDKMPKNQAVKAVSNG